MEWKTEKRSSSVAFGWMWMSILKCANACTLHEPHNRNGVFVSSQKSDGKWKKVSYNTSVKSFGKAFLYCNHIVMYFQKWWWRKVLQLRRFIWNHMWTWFDMIRVTTPGYWTTVENDDKVDNLTKRRWKNSRLCLPSWSFGSFFGKTRFNIFERLAHEDEKGTCMRAANLKWLIR